MKTSKLSSGVLALLVIAASGAMFSCASEESMLTTQNKFYEKDSKKTFNLEDQTHLNRLASALAKESNTITIVEDAEVVELTDTQGDFKAISVTYAIGNQATRMIAPITEVSTDNTALNSASTYYTVPAESCVMKFSVTNEELTYEIIERCKILKGTGVRSSTSIIFDNLAISKSLEEVLEKGSTSLMFKDNTIR